MTSSNQASIHAVDAQGKLAPVAAQSLVIEFAGGRSLECTSALPSGDLRQEHVSIWGGRMPRGEQSERHGKSRTYGLSLTPCAANLIAVSPSHRDGVMATGPVKFAAADNDGRLTPVVAESVVFEFPDGQSLEFAWHAESNGISIYGGRMPRREWSFGRVRARTLALAILPSAGNVVCIYPYAPPLVRNLA